MSIVEEEPEDELLAFMNRRQRQVMVHSCLYYRLDANIITDHQFDAIAHELAQLIVDHPETFKRSVYYEAFIDFDGSTGMDLPTYLPHVVSKALHLLNYHNELLRRAKNQESS